MSASPDEEMGSVEEVTISFTLPNTDFDLVLVENALQWVRTKVMAGQYPYDDQGGMDAFRLLHLLHTRALKAIGHEEWIQTSLIFKEDGQEFQVDQRPPIT